MTRTCPACGAIADDPARFCAECGAPLTGEAAPPSAPPSPPAVPQPQPPVYSAAAGQGRPGQPPGYGGPAQRKEAPALIPYHNQPALVGYYLAIFSLIPCLGLPLGIAAVVLGVMGLRKERDDPGVKGKGHAWTAIVLGGLMTLVWGALLVLGLLASSQGW